MAWTVRKLHPQLTLLHHRDAVLPVSFLDFGSTGNYQRGVPVRYLETVSGRVPVTTVFDLLMAQCGVSRGLDGDEPANYEDEQRPFTPAWQEKFTGVGRETVIQLAREWAATAERTGGKCTIIIGSGINHWYHSNLHYRAGATALMLCGCVGVNGGGSIITPARRNWRRPRPGRAWPWRWIGANRPGCRTALVSLCPQRPMAL